MIVVHAIGKTYDPSTATIEEIREHGAWLQKVLDDTMARERELQGRVTGLLKWNYELDSEIESLQERLTDERKAFADALLALQGAR